MKLGLLLVVLLVAGFLYMAYTSQSTNFEECGNLTSERLALMSLALERANVSGSSEQYEFRLSGCFNQEKESIWIDTVAPANECMMFCEPEKWPVGPATKWPCSLLAYRNSDRYFITLKKCVNIPVSAQFPAGATPECPSRPGYSLVDFMSKSGENRQGNYLLVNGGQNIICGYRQN